MIGCHGLPEYRIHEVSGFFASWVAVGGVRARASDALRFATSARPHTPPTAASAQVHGLSTAETETLDRWAPDLVFFTRDPNARHRSCGLRQGADFAKRSAYEAPCLSPHGPPTAPTRP